MYINVNENFMHKFLYANCISQANPSNSSIGKYFLSYEYTLISLVKKKHITKCISHLAPQQQKSLIKNMKTTLQGFACFNSCNGQSTELIHWIEQDILQTRCLHKASGCRIIHVEQTLSEAVNGGTTVERATEICIGSFFAGEHFSYQWNNRLFLLQLNPSSTELVLVFCPDDA